MYYVQFDNNIINNNIITITNHYNRSARTVHTIQIAYYIPASEEEANFFSL